MKQILLALNEKDSFIIDDLDDFHVVIKADEEYRVRRELEAEVRPSEVPAPGARVAHPGTLPPSLRRTRTVWSEGSGGCERERSREARRLLLLELEA